MSVLDKILDYKIHLCSLSRSQFPHQRSTRSC